MGASLLQLLLTVSDCILTVDHEMKEKKLKSLKIAGGCLWAARFR